MELRGFDHYEDVNVEEKLGINKFNVDEENPHIVLKKEGQDTPEYRKEFEKLVIACPANLIYY